MCETYRTSGDTFTVSRTMDAEPIMEGVRMMGDSQMQAPNRDLQGRLYLGSIDPYTAQIWAKECGARIYSKEWTAYAKKRLMSGDYSKYQASKRRGYFNGNDLHRV